MATRPKQVRSLTPLADRLVVRRQEAVAQVGSIIIPDAAREQPAEGVVVSVGEGRTYENGLLRPIPLKPGDNILFGKYAGAEVVINDVAYIIMRQEEVLGIVVEETIEEEYEPELAPETAEPTAATLEDSATAAS